MSESTEATALTRHAPRHRRHEVHRGRRVACALLLAIVGVVAAFVIAFGRSVSRVSSDMTNVGTAYATLQSQLGSFDGDGACTTVHAIASSCADARTETAGWLWDLAAAVPVWGSDVTTGRTLVSMADDLATGATVPVVEKVAALMDAGVVDDGGNVSAIELTLHTQEVSDVIDAIKTAGPVIARSDETIDAVGDTHFDELDSAIAGARSSLDSLNGSVGTLTSTSSTLSFIKAAFKLLTNG